MNMFQEEQTKLQTEDCMIFTTNDNLEINEISENVVNFTNITPQKMKLIEESSGKQINMKDFIPDLENIMISEFGESIIPTRYDLSLANKIVSCKTFNNVSDKFFDSITFPCLMTYT